MLLPPSWLPRATMELRLAHVLHLKSATLITPLPILFVIGVEDSPSQILVTQTGTSGPVFSGYGIC